MLEQNHRNTVEARRQPPCQRNVTKMLKKQETSLETTNQTRQF